MLKTGVLSTAQDMGRWGYLAQGVPVSGAMDKLAAYIANLAVGNTEDQAVIEFTYADAAFRVESDALIAYSGDGATWIADGRILPPDRPIYLPQGTHVQLAHHPKGCRTYLAIAGGWCVADVLGSKSTYLPATFGGFHGRALQPGDELKAADHKSDIAKEHYRRLRKKTINYPNWAIGRSLLFPNDRNIVRVAPAREFNWFDGGSVVDFLSARYTVGNQSDRMGYRLEGPRIRKLVKRELLSTAVTPGTIQVTGDGDLVLLMADCQTTGGYPRIGQIAAVDMPLCAQLKPGDGIYFREISQRDAEKLYLHFKVELDKLAVALTINV